MSYTLDTILKNGVGYKSEDYCGKEYYTLDEMLDEELNVLKNIDIPLYLSKESIIDIEEYFLNDEELLNAKDKHYNKWLKNNKIDDTEETFVLFKEDCNMQKLQKKAEELSELIVSEMENRFGTFSDEIKCIWLSNKDFAEDKFSNREISSFNLPDKYFVLTDLDEEGILIAFK